MGLCYAASSGLRAYTDVDYVTAHAHVTATPAPGDVTAACLTGGAGYHEVAGNVTRYVYCVNDSLAYVATCPAGFAYVHALQVGLAV